MSRLRRKQPDADPWRGPWFAYGFRATVAHSGDCGTPWIYPSLPTTLPHCPDCIRARSRKAHRAMRYRRNP